MKNDEFCVVLPTMDSGENLRCAFFDRMYRKIGICWRQTLQQRHFPEPFRAINDRGRQCRPQVTPSRAQLPVVARRAKQHPAGY
jgi:hypothetical protein